MGHNSEGADYRRTRDAYNLVWIQTLYSSKRPFLSARYYWEDIKDYLEWVEDEDRQRPCSTLHLPYDAAKHTECLPQRFVMKRGHRLNKNTGSWSEVISLCCIFTHAEPVETPHIIEHDVRMFRVVSNVALTKERWRTERGYVGFWNANPDVWALSASATACARKAETEGINHMMGEIE